MTRRSGGWLGTVLVDLLAAPPPGLVTRPGGLRVNVVSPAGTDPYVWYPAVILAWAPLPRGGWACLMVWQALRRQEAGPPRMEARWSWCRYGAARVQPGGDPVPEPNPWGMRWFGHDPGGSMSAAITEAAASLPSGLRRAAAWPAPAGTGLPT